MIPNIIRRDFLAVNFKIILKDYFRTHASFHLKLDSVLFSRVPTYLVINRSWWDHGVWKNVPRSLVHIIQLKIHVFHHFEGLLFHQVVPTVAAQRGAQLRPSSFLNLLLLLTDRSNPFNQLVRVTTPRPNNGLEPQTDLLGEINSSSVDCKTTCCAFGKWRHRTGCSVSHARPQTIQ